jgi:quercetin dioxygenase-like cupin family protein
MRDPDLQHLIDVTSNAFAARIEKGTRLATLSDHIFKAAADDIGVPAVDAAPETLTVCRHLAPALVAAATGSPETAAVADAFSKIASHLTWRRRIPGKNDQEGFADNHANATLIGNGGLEQRDDIRMGASLVAPATVYPDHTHPPEEMYLVLSESEWRNADTDWHAPGIGGIVHNPPGIVHAMRAQDAPLFAIWCLWSPQSSE